MVCNIQPKRTLNGYWASGSFFSLRCPQVKMVKEEEKRIEIVNKKKIPFFFATAKKKMNSVRIYIYSRKWPTRNNQHTAREREREWSSGHLKSL